MCVMDAEVEDEIEALRAIYCEELDVMPRERGTPGDGCCVLGMDLYPATGDVKEEQLIKIRLEVELTPGYPNDPPKIVLKDSRGLSDDSIEEIRLACQRRIESRLGEPVLYDLIHIVTETLTEKNVPSGTCCICLEGFDGQVPGGSSSPWPVVKTTCFHHLHEPCLRRYVRATAARIREEQQEWAALNPYGHRAEGMENKLCCPVCREALPESRRPLDALGLLEPATDGDDDDDEGTPVVYTPDPGARQYWDRMRVIYERQLARGGIINPSDDETRRLVVISSTPSTTTSSIRDGSVPGAGSGSLPPPTSTKSKNHAESKKKHAVAGSNAAPLRKRTARKP